LNDLPILDPAPLHDLLDMGGTEGLVQELITLYQEDVPIRLALLKTALGALDGVQTMAEAHQLKGALGNLGLLRFADMAASIETHAREGHLDQAPPLAEGLPVAYQEALAALKMAFPEA